MPALESYFFLQLPEQGLLDRFVLAYSTLRKLPATTSRSLAQEHLARVAHQHDAYIGPITLRVDPVTHVPRFTGCHAAEQGSGQTLQRFLRIYRTMSRDFASLIQSALRIP